MKQIKIFIARQGHLCVFFTKRRQKRIGLGFLLFNIRVTYQFESVLVNVLLGDSFFICIMGVIGYLRR